MSTLPSDVTRTLQGELAPSPSGAFSLLNLAGSMTVVPATGSVVRVKATVHAESEELAASITLTTTTGREGEPSLLFKYPVERFDRFRYPARNQGPDTGVEYSGRKVRLSSSEGVMVYADLVVEVPTGVKQSRLEVGAGAIEAERLDGDLGLDTGSGSVRLSRSRGSFSCATGGGTCQVEDSEGDRLTCDSGSGSVLVSRAKVRELKVDTGSGNVKLDGIEAEEISIDSGSGPVEVEALGSRLRKVSADTGSGSVHLRLAADAGFEARADLGSGGLRCTFPDAQKIVKAGEVVGCRRGDGRIAIRVDTGSGGLVIEPIQ